MPTSTYIGAFVTLVLGACGPAARDGGDGTGTQVDAALIDAAPGGDGGGGGGVICSTDCATVTGTIWAPNLAPGIAAPGDEVPVFGAAIYVSVEKPEPIPAGAYCEACVATGSTGVLSRHDGTFKLTVAAGDYWLVIQKGQWRSERQVHLGIGDALGLSDVEGMLPTVQDPDNGMFIPHIAVAIGSTDKVEDILGKIGYGEMTNDAMSSTGNEVDLYTNSGTSLPVVGTAESLLSSVTTMLQYHIIFFPCSTHDLALLRDQAILKNIRQYVNQGGKLYVTDWSGEVADRAFPTQIELGGDVPFGDPIDSKGSYDPVALTGTLSAVGSSDGDAYDSADGLAVDADLAAWLGGQRAPTENDAVPTPIDPTHFPVTDNWNWIKQLNEVVKGHDATTGEVIYDSPKAWVSGSRSFLGGGRHPQAVTYEPTGCGRVLFSTFQTATSHHPGLYPQERILVYLIMNIGVCTDDPVFE